MTLDSEALLDLSLSRGTLHRNGTGRRDRDVLAQALARPDTQVIDLVDGRVRTQSTHGRLALVRRDPRPEDRAASALYLGHDHAGTDYVAVLADHEDADHDGADQKSADQKSADTPEVWRTLREAGAELDDTDSGVLTTATALANWHARHGFCPRCGGATTVEQGGWVRRCTSDGSEHYPRTDAAIIVAVTDAADRLLLARGPHWPEGRRSVLAGFVEAGEALEATVAREVMEEVGVELTDITYRGNQPWPFPASLMVGYTARARETELTLDPTEIVEADWFTRHQVVTLAGSGELALPPRVSIARVLIERWMGERIVAASDHPGRGEGR